MTDVTADGVDTDFIPKESDTRRLWPNRATDITRATGTRVLLALALASLVAIYFWRDVFVTVARVKPLSNHWCSALDRSRSGGL